ncbi:MAG: OprD family outer membrane porin [Endozoicomonas sp.]
MSRYKLSLLSLAASLASLPGVSFSAFDTATPFIDDTKLGGKLRTVYYNVEDTYDKDQGRKPYRAGAWTGAAQVNLQSGYFEEILAVGASVYGVAKLSYDSDKFKDSYQLLKGDGDKEKGFSKLGQVWIDLKFGQEKAVFNGHAKIGRQSLYAGLISSSGSRSVPSTWQGVNFEASLYQINFKVAYVDKMSLRNEDEFNDLTNFENKKIDYIIGGEVGHTFSLSNDQTLKLKYRNAFSKDFLQAHNGDISWSIPLAEKTRLTLGGMLYYTKENGNLWTGDVWGKKSFDKDATAGNLNATLDVGGWSFEAAVSTFKAEAKTAMLKEGKSYAAPAVYYYDLGKNTHGIWGVPTSGFAEDMLYDGETAWKLGFSYDFTTLGAKGLQLGYAYHYGTGMKVTDRNGDKKKVSEYEHDVFIKYAFPEEILKGLEFKLKYGMYRNDKELREAISKEESDLRVWLDYNFTLL